MGLDGPYPADVKPPALDPARPQIKLTQFPAKYVTPFHTRMRRLWWKLKDGYPPRSDGVLHWPAVMVQAFEVLDAETALRDKRRGDQRH